MAIKLKRKLKRTFKRWLKNRPVVFASVLLLTLGSLFIYTNYMQDKRLSVDMKTYSPLLHLISGAESKGNYNAYFGNSANTETDFTKMSVAEVMKWQEAYVAAGSASSAVGKYQIMDTTLKGLVQQLAIDTSLPFDEVMQDRMAIALLERRGSVQYINEELSKEQFAANLAKEWAALPKVIGENADQSYYASDGLNRALVSVGDVMKAIEPIRSN